MMRLLLMREVPNAAEANVVDGEVLSPRPAGTLSIDQCGLERFIIVFIINHHTDYTGL
jgi:hypothetical protein